MSLISNLLKLYYSVRIIDFHYTIALSLLLAVQLPSMFHNHHNFIVKILQRCVVQKLFTQNGQDKTKGYYVGTKLMKGEINLISILFLHETMTQGKCVY